MCGRYVIYDEEKALERFDADLSIKKVDLAPHYNAAPSQQLPTILRNSPNHMEFMRWGLIPAWAKDPSIGYKMINARAETVATKPSFRHAFKSQRCIIPANGFYEWKQSDDGKTKIPYYIRRKDHMLFGFAGLWESWNDAEGKEIRSFTIITTTPNKVMEKIHDRMPVILEEKDETTWLDPKNENIQELQSILVPYESQLEAIRVSTLVNSPKNQGEVLIKETSE